MAKKTKKRNRWKDSVFLGSSGEATFSQKETDQILSLMAAQSQAVRSAYQSRKSGLEGYQVAQHLKFLGHGATGVRYLTAAISQAEQLPLDRSVLFGGKKLWDQLQAGEISTKQWHAKRNNRLFSRGDKSKKGNPLIRIEKNTISVLIPKMGSKGTWIKGKAKLFRPFPQEAQACYNVRLIHTKKRQFQIEIAWNSHVEQIETVPGIIGLDTNPDLLAALELNEHGNMIARHTIELPRVTQAQTEKREADIFLAAKEIVEIAKKAKKPIGLESLNFGQRTKRPKNKPRNRGFNRMRCGWAYRALLDAVKRRAHKEGVPVVEVPPGYTSILGIAKFAEMYELNRHHAAALVIGRRAMGLKQERQNFTIILKEKKQKKPRGTANTARQGQRNGPARKPLTPATKTRQVRLTPTSFSHLRRYLRGVDPSLPAPDHNGRVSRLPTSKQVQNLPPSVDENRDCLPVLPGLALGEGHLLTTQT